ncbi:MAG: phospho-N-acetylmuramoyl-pentapeptide-transferase [Eubacteriales bacterium]|nr:phospho-N-acetylmuramoyl-pentapeptide-transferase [Eubacteriales bacterium]
MRLYIALLIAFLTVLVLSPYGIKVLHKLKFGQQERDDAVKEHMKKQGTPTMGGIMILAGIILGSVVGFMSTDIMTGGLQVLFLTVSFGIIGFMDDFLKIKMKNTKGLLPWQKLALQLIVTIVFAVWRAKSYLPGTEPMSIIIPFTGKWIGIPSWLFYPFVILVVLGTDNGVNFTDGLDGLCSSVTIPVAAFFAFVSLVLGEEAVTAVCVAVIGALCGFLFFNSHPAKVFMGDTGSLALGGFVAASAVVTGSEIFIPIVGFIYLIEVLSVIIQVGYFKATHGKRVFRMAPIHHHYELGGNSETQIVTAFTILTGLLAILGVLGLLV